MKAEKTESGFRIFNSISKKQFLLVLYIVVTVSFVFIVKLHERGYQDAWILDGVLIPTMIFIYFFLVVEMFISDNRLVALIGGSFLAVLNLIVGLKYQLFYGCYDSVEHYGYIETLIFLGHVPETGFYSEYYSCTPGLHIFLGSLSLISGIPTNDILRFIFPAIYGIIPLIVFFVTKGIFDKTIQRYVIIASSFPIMGYVLSGTRFSLILFFLYFGIFLRCTFMNRDKVKNRLVLIIVAYSLIISHGVTSFFLSFLLIGMVFVLKFLRLMRKRFPSWSLIYSYVTASSFFTVLLLAWWTFKANIYINTLADILNEIFIAGIKKERTPIPIRFFEIPLLERLKILALYHLNDIIMATISLLGLFVLIREFKRKEPSGKTKDFYLHLLLFFSIVSAVVSFQLGIKFGEIEYSRFVCYAIVFSPFFVGLALWRLDKFLITTFRKARIKNLAFASILFVIVSSGLIQIFPYQPLVPRASALSKDLPEDEYLCDFRLTNTIYQKEMISFAERCSTVDSIITSDKVTRCQIFGFTNPSFSSRQIWDSPLSSNETLEWNLCLLHMSGKAGPFAEKAEYRTEELINRLRSGANTIYDNGESFIIAHEDRTI